MKHWALSALFALSLLGDAIGADLLRAPPPEEVDPFAADLHTELLRIIADKDAAALAALADEEVKLSFGGDYGRDTLLEWTKEDWFWPEWRRITAYPPSLHGSGEGAYLAYPWIFVDWPHPLDPFGHVLAGEGATLKARPEAEAQPVAEVGFAVLQAPAEPDDAPDGWQRLCIDSASCGYLEAESVISPIDWRGIFLFEDGRWRLTAFVAGD